eukprot:5413538-Pyramimonas_sp.AAC.1
MLPGARSIRLRQRGDASATQADANSARRLLQRCFSRGHGGGDGDLVQTGYSAGAFAGGPTRRAVRVVKQVKVPA